MKTLKKGKFMAFLATVAMVASMGMSVTASATQSRTDYFNKRYSQGSSPASNMVAVAKAQLGKTGSQLHYSEQWCADFTTDVARLANNVGTNAIPYNYSGRGSCALLYNYMMKNCNAKVVANSQAKAGDIIFFDWSGNKRNFNHVGIVVSNSNGKITMIGGNQGSSGSLYYRKVTQTVYTTSNRNINKIVRPNYSGGNNNNNNNNNNNCNNNSNKTGTYTVRSNSGATVRTGPGTSYSKAGGGIAKGSVVTYDKTANANGYTWYHITKVSAKSGTWGKNVGYWIANV